MPVGSARRLVALSLPPGEDFVDAAEAVWADGGAILPLDPGAPQDVVRRLVDALRPHAIVDADGEHALAAAEAVEDDVAVVIATSGSTGEPKGAELSWDALHASGSATAQRLGSDPADAWLSCLPWQHIGGLQVWLRARAAGVPLEVHPRFDLGAAARSGATLVSLVPTQLARLLAAGVDLSRFRAILLGGAAAPAGLLERARAAGARVVTTYGMSETCGGCVYDGVPLAGVEVATGDDGRIRIRGPVLMSGYRLRPDLTASALVDGWLVTQDIGTFADGRLRVFGRVDDIVVSGGENIATTAVAEVLSAHPDVRDVAVTGVPDEEWGERLVAVVVAGTRPPTLDELRRWVTARVGGKAAPRTLVLVPRIPRLTSGKPDRLAVRALAQESSAGSAGYGSQSASPPSIS
ncbi:MAG TPA: AMP-binding protein [Mycobacteriales bacterium]|nr:AMP-binding protein [Mycobacteriales bacterium]